MISKYITLFVLLITLKLSLRFVLHFGTLIIYCRRYLKYTRTIICILTLRSALKYTTSNLILRVITLRSFRPLPNSKNFVILEVVAEKSISQDNLSLRFDTKTTWFNPSRFSNRKLYISLIIMHKLPCIFALVISFFLSIVLLSLNVFLAVFQCFFSLCYVSFYQLFLVSMLILFAPTAPPGVRSSFFRCKKFCNFT